ncbi:MAG: hypothetical protein L0Z50_42845 [Verrucomicrobiales bacterium]|nr:hypothetical protein [Verrucomicrobiales bacterium]
MKCLEKDRTRRYETANGLAMDIQRHRSHEPVVARPPSAAYRFQKLIRRNKLVFTAVTAVASALTDREYLYQARVAFSPVRNLLAATSEPMVVRLYDLDSGQEAILWRAPDPDAWKVRDVSFSQDGSRLVIYAGTRLPELGDDGVWVVNVSTCQIESHHPTGRAGTEFHGTARLSPDQRRLYLEWRENLNSRQGIHCLDLVTGQKVWRTEPQLEGLTTLAISPDGRTLASGSGFEDPVIRVWDTDTGRLLVRLEGHTSWIGRLEFTKDGQRLISAAADQSIRFWDTTDWMETKVLRGHTDEVHALAISDAAGLVASASKDGDLKLWRTDAPNAPDGYRRLPQHLGGDQVLCLGHSRLLLLPPGKPPEWVDLKQDPIPVSVPAIGSSADVLGWFGTNTLCQWDGTNQVLIRELRGAEFVHDGAMSLDSAERPAGIAYCVARQLLAWSQGTSSTSVFVASLASQGQRIELKSDIPGLVPFRFSDDGKYLQAGTTEAENRGVRRVWNVQTTEIVASLGERWNVVTFAAGGRVLVAAVNDGNGNEIRFYDLTNPGRAYRHVAWKHICGSVAASADGGLVAASSHGGEVRLFDPAKGTLIDTLHGHLNAAHTIAFSPDGQRLISTSSGRETVKVWDVGTRQELLTLAGTASTLGRWSADGDVILAGAPWQAWRAPSWEEIGAAEAKEKVENKQP